MAEQRPGSDKERTKKQSRSVSTTKRAPTKAARRSGLSPISWLAIGVVLIVVVALVIYAVTMGSSSSNAKGEGSSPAPASLVSQVTQIPESVYNTVGVTSSVAPVSPPKALTGYAPLTFPDASGTQKPGVFYYGAEYCPYCAAERWAFTAAISRFGPITGLGITSSSSTDVYPNTPTFSFYKASFGTTDVEVRAVEHLSNIPSSNGQGYTILANPTSSETALLKKLDPNGTIPLITFGNQFLVSGASFSPAILANLTRDEIASNLNDPSNPVTQAIISTANYMTASICKITNGQPGDVCSSSGVQTAAKAMKISF
jgi:Domain of unknown function (DUF929)